MHTAHATITEKIQSNIWMDLQIERRLYTNMEEYFRWGALGVKMPLKNTVILVFRVLNIHYRSSMLCHIHFKLRPINNNNALYWLTPSYHRLSMKMINEWLKLLDRIWEISFTELQLIANDLVGIRRKWRKGLIIIPCLFYLRKHV